MLPEEGSLLTAPLRSSRLSSLLRLTWGKLTRINCWPSGCSRFPAELPPLTLTFCLPLSQICHCSVASALHSDNHDRYERLTSVSSSVDFDQRDNVSSGRRQKQWLKYLCDEFFGHPRAVESFCALRGGPRLSWEAKLLGGGQPRGRGQGEGSAE